MIAMPCQPAFLGLQHIHTQIPQDVMHHIAAVPNTCYGRYYHMCGNLPKYQDFCYTNCTTKSSNIKGYSDTLGANNYDITKYDAASIVLFHA